MTEKWLVVDGLKLSYSGLFSIKELLDEIGDGIQERNYKRYEKKADERVTEDGRELILDLRPGKVIKEDYWASIKLRIRISHIQDVIVLTSEGFRKQLQQGNITIYFDGWIQTNLENAWEAKPIVQFIQKLFDKYVYNVTFGRYEDMLSDDVHYLRDKLKAHLNIYRYAGEIMGEKQAIKPSEEMQPLNRQHHSSQTINPPYVESEINQRPTNQQPQ